MYVEKAATSENEVAIVSRPGLAAQFTNGTGPINGLFSKEGTFADAVFSLSGNALYRGTTLIGTIDGSGPVSWAGSSTEVLVTRGASLWSYNGTNLQQVTFPDSASVRAVCFIGSRFVALRGDGLFPGRFYWSNLLDGRTWDALNYATAERQPDDALDIADLGDNIWIFGQESVEAWAQTGDLNLPFSRIENLAFDKGIYSTGCVAKADNSLFFTGSSHSVYRIADVPQRISDHWLEEQVRLSGSLVMFSHWRDGHEFVVLRLGAQTFAYDCATNSWCENQTNEGQWIACCACMAGNVAYFGHQSTGQVLGWSGWTDLGTELERRFTAALELDAPLSVDRLHLWANTGQTAVLGTNPQVEMRSSRDGGETWTDYDGASLGAAGQYRTIPEWRRMGQFDFPGMIFDFRCTDPVPFRVSAVKYNDPAGGRSR